MDITDLLIDLTGITNITEQDEVDIGTSNIQKTKDRARNLSKTGLNSGASEG
jgi:hypothetical protein